jgi:hypothetical protein
MGAGIGPDSGAGAGSGAAGVLEVVPGIAYEELGIGADVVATGGPGGSMVGAMAPPVSTIGLVASAGRTG